MPDFDGLFVHDHVYAGGNNGVLYSGQLLPVASNVYLNRVVSTIAGKFVFWKTSFVDSGGSNYPGPGTWGIDTSDYTYSRLT